MSGGNAYKRKSHRRIEVITSVAAVVVLYVILESFGVTCPIKYITGISCAGCGMSRAWISLLHFNIHDAFMYHPLFFLPPVVVIVMLLKSDIPLSRTAPVQPRLRSLRLYTDLSSVFLM